MGYTNKTLNSKALNKIIKNCDRLLENSKSRPSINSKITELDDTLLKELDFKSDAELELTYKRTFDKKYIVLRIEATLSKSGKPVLVVKKI